MKRVQSCLEMDDIIIYTSSSKEEVSYVTIKGGDFTRDLLWENGHEHGLELTDSERDQEPQLFYSIPEGRDALPKLGLTFYGRSF